MVGLSLSYNAIANLFRRYYSTLGPRGGFNVSIDGSTPQRLDPANSNTYLFQRLLWSNVSLSPGRHNITITHDGPLGVVLSLDFFRSVINNVR